jgi:molybdate transport system ATP-binding protein
MSLHISIQHRLGLFALDANFETAGRLTAIFGASGSGKTSLVNAIAGLLKPDSGRISVEGMVLTDTARDIHVPPHDRGVGYVFQDARLFPHLSVTQNLAYGQWFTPRQKRYAKSDDIVSMLDIAHLLDRKPHHLSGGERQRVALGRALLQSPRLLLMDEPLASLDQARKLEILPYIERLRDELHVPIVYVSHSMSEVSRLATDIVVMAQGRVAQSGHAEVVIRTLGLEGNEDGYSGGALLTMTVASYDSAADLTILSSLAGEARVPGMAGALGSLVRLRIDARDVMIAMEEPKNISALNIFRGQIAAISDEKNASVAVTVDCGGVPILARITRQSRAVLGLRVGLPVYAVVKSVRVDAPRPAPR